MRQSAPAQLAHRRRVGPIIVGALGHARVSARLADLGACPSAGFRSLDAEFHTTGPPFTPRAGTFSRRGHLAKPQRFGPRQDRSGLIDEMLRPRRGGRRCDGGRGLRTSLPTVLRRHTRSRLTRVRRARSLLPGSRSHDAIPWTPMRHRRRCRCGLRWRGLCRGKQPCAGRPRCELLSQWGDAGANALEQFRRQRRTCAGSGGAHVSRSCGMVLGDRHGHL